MYLFIHCMFVAQRQGPCISNPDITVKPVLLWHLKHGTKWIKDLNVRPETIKLLEENIGKTLSDINHSRILYDPPPRILEINKSPCQAVWLLFSYFVLFTLCKRG